MGALDDLIARASGGNSKLDELMQQAQAAQLAESEPPPVGAVSGAPSRAPEPEQPWYTKLLNAAPLPGKMLADPGTQALTAGFQHGVTAGVDQNIPGAIGEANRARYEEQRASRPELFNAADAVGAVAMPTTPGAALAGKPVISAGLRIGQRALEGAAIGGARDYSDNQDAMHALAQSGNTAQFAAALSGAGEVASGVVGAMGRGAGTVADSARLRSTRTGVDTLTNFADRRGLGAAEAPGAYVGEVERLVPPNTLIPRSTGEWADAATGPMNTAGRGVDAALLRAKAEGARLPPDVRAHLANDLSNAARDARTSGFGDVADARALEARARGVRMGPPLQDPIDIRRQKTGFDARAFAGERGTPQASTGASFKAAGDNLRGVLDDFAEQGSPATQALHEQSANDFGVLVPMQRDARAGAMQEATGGGRPGYAGLGGSMTNRILSAVPGGSTTQDAIANAGRIGQGAGALGAGAGAAVSNNAPQLAGMRQALGQGQQSPQTTYGQGRGNLMGQAAGELLQREPGALGQWEQDIQRAVQDGSIDQLLGKLNRDPEFRMGPGMRLRQMTAGK